MPKHPTRQPIPASVRDTLRRLGAAIRAARMRRRWSQVLLAQKAGIALMTLRKAEKGDLGMTLATYVTILWVLGLDHLLDLLADPSVDREGLAFEPVHLGTRVRARRELDDAF